MLSDMTQDNPNENTTVEDDDRAGASMDNNKARFEKQDKTKQEVPDFNMRSKTQARTLTQEVVLQAMEISGRGAKLTA